MSEYNYIFNESDYYDESCCGTVCGQQISMNYEAVFVPVLYSVAVVLGLLGHGLVLVVLWQKRRGWSATDTFILHLSIADILLLLTMPLWAVQAAKDWIFGTVVCKVTGALFQMNFYCGIFLLACISLDRYLSIVHAVQMYSRKKPWLIQLSCMAVWFFSLMLSIPEWIYLKAVEDFRREKIECVPNYPFNTHWRTTSRWLYHLVGSLIPALVILFCLICILLTLQIGSQGKQKQRAMRVILALVVVFFICWTPYNLTLLVDTIHTNLSHSNSSDACDTTTALDIALSITSTLGYLHCCMNPILYAFVEVKFRRHLLDMASRRNGRESTVSHQTSIWSESVDTSAF
ncbi:C-X-C chemokine receptor type 3-like [Hoplias malabaricus]|uniref:C-X-C chemokine receptor type 3-like n=1 Tax=Hoplias malabaricus TaxID=27720 RepID=UPI0034621C1B